MFPFSFFICDDSFRCCEAGFHFKAVVHIYAKSTRYNEKIKATAERLFWPTSLLLSLSLKFFACKLKLALLKLRIRQERANPDPSAG